MADTEDEYRARSSRPAPKTAEQTAPSIGGVITGTISFIFTTITTLFTSMVVSVLVALVGVTFVWPEKGADHERETLAVELKELATSLTDAGGGFSASVANMVSSSLDAWYGPGIVSAAVEWVSGLFTQKAQMYGEVTLLAMQIFVVRLGVILSSMPILAIWIVVAIVAGLAERDLRRYNAADESSTIFNLAVEHIKVPFLLLVALYLSWPTTAYAIVAMLPVCFGSFFMVYIAIARYKKRL